MSKSYTIYAHISPSNKAYIGITGRKPSKRWGHNGYGYRSQPKFYRAILKYGWNSFKHLILFETPLLEEAYLKEKEFIKKYDSFYNGYNSDLGGRGAEGHIVSVEAREVMSKLKLGKPAKTAGKQRKDLMIKIFVYDLNKNLINTFLGYEEASRALSLNTSNLRNAANYGFVLENKYLVTNEKTNVLLDTFYNKYLQSQNAMGVILYDEAGNILGQYKTYQDASKATGLSVGNIGKCCIGIILRTSKGIFLKPSDSIGVRLKIISNELAAPEKPKRAKILKVQQFSTTTDELLAEFDNYQQAADATGISRKQITHICNGHAKTAGEFYFKKILEV